MANRIHLKGPFQLDELVAEEVITPGHLLERTTTGTYQKNTKTDDHGEFIVAQEDALQGRTLADDYAIGDRVFGVIPGKGSEVLVFLQGGVNIADGASLSSGGDGTMILGAGADTILCFTVEALDLTALPAALVKVRVV